MKTNVAGVYGYNFSANYITEGGFSVAILGADGAPLDPGAWNESDRPSFLFEIFDPI